MNKKQLEALKRDLENDEEREEREDKEIDEYLTKKKRSDLRRLTLECDVKSDGNQFDFA